MTRTTSEALGAAAASMTADEDVVGTLTRLLIDGKDLLQADEAAIIVVAHGRAELLTSTSHSAEALELLQTELDEGPCLDAVRLGERVTLDGADELDQRWPRVGPLMANAGFSGVRAIPLRWHAHVVGSLNLFRHDGAADGDHLEQAFADIATLALVSNARLDPSSFTRRLSEVLGTRTVIEQAKGVLAHSDGLSPAAAYAVLLGRVAAGEGSIVQIASRVVDAAAADRGGPRAPGPSS